LAWRLRDVFEASDYLHDLGWAAGAAEFFQRFNHRIEELYELRPATHSRHDIYPSPRFRATPLLHRDWYFQRLLRRHRADFFGDLH
jgi:hypothetical protein